MKARTCSLPALAEAQAASSSAQPRCWVPLGGNRKRCRVVTWLQETAAIAVAGDDGLVRLYNLNGDEINIIRTQQGQVHGVVEGGVHVVLTAGSNGTIAAWDVRENPRKTDFCHMKDQKTCSAMCSVDSTRAVVGNVHGDLCMLSWNNNRLGIVRHVSQAHYLRITDMHAHGSHIATVSLDQTVSLWNRHTFICEKVLYFPTPLHSVRMNDAFIAVGSTNYVRMFSNKEPDFLFHADIEILWNVVETIRFIQDDDIVAGAGKEPAIAKASRDNSEDVDYVQTSANVVCDVEFLPDGAVAVCGEGKNANSILCISQGPSGQYRNSTVSEERRSTSQNVSVRQQSRMEEYVVDMEFARSTWGNSSRPEVEDWELDQGRRGDGSQIVTYEEVLEEVRDAGEGDNQNRCYSMTDNCSAASEEMPKDLVTGNEVAETNMEEMPDWKKDMFQSVEERQFAMWKFIEEMASFMCSDWTEYCEPLNRCLRRHFDDNLIVLNDIMGPNSINAEILHSSVAKALKADKQIGGRLDWFIAPWSLF